jgi:hypothetical protein
MLPHEFVDKWRDNTATERQVYQQHFLDLCALVGHGTPAELDRRNEFFTFEAGAAKLGGGNGFADVWYKGHFAIEYKGPQKKLDAAYEQLLQYRESLENPPLLITGNTQELYIHTNFTSSPKRIVHVTLDDLLTPAGLQHIRNLFYHVEAFRPEQSTAQVTEEAAARFGTLAEHLRKWGHAPDAIAHYLIRLLFCLFAEDIDLLPPGLFIRLIDAGRKNANRFTIQVTELFRAMAKGGYFGEHELLHFNGGLFDDAPVLDIDGDAIKILYDIAMLDWQSIEPAIFGTLFTRSLDPGQRAKLGAQYTSKEDIVLIVEPVLMAPLRKEWADIQAEARTLAQQRDASRDRQSKNAVQADLEKLIFDFVRKLATIRILDPACGSGNFLYVALRLLLDLWKAVAIFATEMKMTMPSPIPGQFPSPEQLYGIEINEYAHELAQATVWIGYLQWLHDNGYGTPREPILKSLDNIRQMDAILAYDEAGKPVEPAWPAAEVIVGNPPFLGGKRLRTELGDGYVDRLFDLYDGEISRESDLVCYWFEKARKMIASGIAKRAGLLSTNSIRGGANRRVLERIIDSGRIFWAYADRDWVLEGASVRVSMVAFDNGSEIDTRLDGHIVGRINADLTKMSDLTTAGRLPENLGLSFMGDTKVGPFDIDHNTAQRLLDSSNNPNGFDNRDVVKRWYNGLDVTRRPRNMWIVDFGVDTLETIAANYVLPFEYIWTHVKEFRSQAKSGDRTGVSWWLHQRPRPDMRRALENVARYVATPHVSKHRLFVWLDNEVLPDHQLIVFARSDDYFFGILHSSAHELWSLRMGTSLEDRPRYTSTTTFETFPFPWPPGQEPQDDARVQAIAAAAQDLVEQRDAWLNPPGLAEAELKPRTLTNLYNARPAWLQAAHIRLDAAVFAAYGWPPELSDEEMLARLLALNGERAG